MLDKPIFISGCNRGGTTIVADLLSEHPEVRNIGAGHSFSEGQYIWRMKFPDRSRHRWAVEPWRSQMRKTAGDATPELVRFFRDRFGAELAGRGRFLEKTPANAVRIPFIDACFPDAFFVHVIRDGRDTVCSLMARKVALKYAPLQWVGAHTTALGDLAALAPERVTLVHYEELLAEPTRLLCEIAARSRLAADDRIATRFHEAAARLIEPPASRWPFLDPRDRAYILSVIGDLQGRLGYPVE
jgi:hypothetical protein